MLFALGISAALEPRIMDTNYESHPLLVQPRKELEPQLRMTALALNESLSPAKVSTFAGSVGSATTYHGYQFGIECSFPNVVNEGPDNVAFAVSACHLDGRPRLTADVCWGHPSGHVEATLSEGSSEQWPYASEERIGEVLSSVPRLLVVFANAARRGHP
jgi:hypothetical protein